MIILITIIIIIIIIIIIRYLLECGAFPASVNNEGQTPSDLAEDYDEIIDLLQSEVNRLGVCVCVYICVQYMCILSHTHANTAANLNPQILLATSPYLCYKFPLAYCLVTIFSH